MLVLQALALALLQDPPPKVFDAGYDGGFYVGGPDGRLTIGGLLQVNGSFFESGGPHESEFEVRRMRLEFSGEFYKRWLFNIEPKFVPDGVELEEAWAGFQIDSHSFRFGRMKEPFSQEEMTSQRHMDLLNFSILNQFVPAEDHGLTVLGRFDFLEYGVGFYNGSGGNDTTSDKDVALRLVGHAGGFQAGGAATFGRQDSDIGGEELKTEARVAWAEYAPGTNLDGKRVRLGAETAYLQGPFAINAEWILLRETLNDTTVRFTGGYVQASWVLTGETKTWKGVTPERPFKQDPDIGAWQLVARWSRLQLDDDLAPFVSNFPGRIDSWTAGVNWYANAHVKFKINYLRTNYREDIVIAGSRHGNEDSLLCQIQVMF